MPNHIITLVTTNMIIDQLENLFGKNNPQFNENIAQQMKELMLTDLDLCNGGK